jgi:mono/diheme cytochrome c family protein
MAKIWLKYGNILPFLLAAAMPATAQSPSFETDILPILKARCVACHTGTSPQAGLVLNSLEGLQKGGKSGASIAPGASSRSLLVEKIVSGNMPPAEPKLTPSEIALIREWIDSEGAAHAQLVTERDIVPIFQMRCVVCHGKRRQEGGLDLRTQASRIKGGQSGPSIVPGKPDESLLVKRIAAGEMPPPKLLFDNSVRPPTTAELDTIKKWIASGAPAGPAREAEAAEAGAPMVSDKDRQFWSFQPPARPKVPEVRNKRLVRNPIDAFLLARLEAKGLNYSPEAGRLTLLRRLYMDAIGMPPTPEDVREFQDDSRPDAYEQLVDHLLASSHYGERWGRYWLDGVGYSDSEGKVDADAIRPDAWRYRDYVIRSLNEDKPYDRFLLEQIAGDEMVDYRNVKHPTPELLEKLVATGFWRMAADGTYSPPQSFLPERMNVIADQLEIFGSSVLGLTIGCARCHDHKYDPLPQRDYYRLSAVLQTAYDPYDWIDPTKRRLDIALDEERKTTEAFNAPIEGEIRKLEQSRDTREKPLRATVLEERLAALPEAAREDLRRLAETPKDQRSEVQKYLAEKFEDTLTITTEELARKFPEYKPEADKVRREIADLRAKLRPKPGVRALYEMGGEPSTAYLLRRGDALAPTQPVQPGVPAVLSVGLKPYNVQPIGDSPGRRLALARWLVQPEHPLTARVIVNRIWLHHFGRGIVPSAANFGRTGVLPTHPELLDWLATELVRQKWSLKAIHRLIWTSSAFRQSSIVSPEAEKADPENALLSRMPMRRMDADALFDSILKTTGRLDATQFGPAAPIEVKPDGEVIARGGENGWRRAIYVLQRRRSPLTMLEIFDTPPMSPNCVERPVSTVPTQALQLLNGQQVQDHARYLAGRILDRYASDEGEQVEQAYLHVLSRPAAAEEKKRGAAALTQLKHHWQSHFEQRRESAPHGWTSRWMALGDFVHTLLNSGEFVYVD